MDRIQAIPTIYRGIQMRSRLEAAWALFFDEHGVRWAYEAEGFDFGDVRYLPDFYLPDCRTFVEVKGVMDEASEQKISALAAAAGARGIKVIVGEAPAGVRFHFRASEQGQPYAAFGVCGSCLKGSFYEVNGAWSCGCCGSRNGDTEWTFHIHGEL